MIGKAIGIAVLTLAVCATSADAAQREHRARHTRAAQQPAAPPPPEVARLMAFRGVWAFDGTVAMGRNKPRKLRWRLRCKESAGGWALVCEETMRLPRSPLMHGHDLFGYDAATGMLHFYTVNSMGEVRDMPGKWVDERTIHYRYSGNQGGKPMAQEGDVVIRDENAFDIDLKVMLGGEPQAAFHGTFHKVPPRARRAAAPAPAEAPATPAP